MIKLCCWRKRIRKDKNTTAAAAVVRKFNTILYTFKPGLDYDAFGLFYWKETDHLLVCYFYNCDNYATNFILPIKVCFPLYKAIHLFLLKLTSAWSYYNCTKFTIYLDLFITGFFIPYKKL